MLILTFVCRVYEQPEVFFVLPVPSFSSCDAPPWLAEIPCLANQSVSFIPSGYLGRKDTGTFASSPVTTLKGAGWWQDSLGSCSLSRAPHPAGDSRKSHKQGVLAQLLPWVSRACLASVNDTSPSMLRQDAALGHHSSLSSTAQVLYTIFLLLLLPLFAPPLLLFAFPCLHLSLPFIYSEGFTLLPCHPN